MCKNEIGMRWAIQAFVKFNKFPKVCEECMLRRIDQLVIEAEIATGEDEVRVVWRANEQN